MAWYDANYLNRKLITIAGTADGAQTNYQLKLNVYKSAGNDSGNSVYLGTKVKDDFSDIRFTKTDGTSLLDYWVESVVSGTSAVIWIEFDSIPIAAGTATFYIYYNYASAATASNGTNTFIKFDDASSDQSANYTLRDLYNASLSATLAWVSASAGYKITITSNDVVMAEINTLSAGGAYRLRAQLNVTPITGHNAQLGLAMRYSASGLYFGRSAHAPNVAVKLLDIVKEPTPPNTSQTQLVATNYTNYATAGAWYRAEVHAYGSALYYWNEWEDRSVSVSDASYASGTWGIFGGHDTNSLISFKNITVGKFTANEPTWGAWGAEETSGWTHIAKVSGVTASAIAKVNGVAVAAVAKVNGVAV